MSLRRHLPVSWTWRSVSETVGIPGTRLSQVKHTPLGVELTLQLVAPTTASDIEAAADAVGVAYGVARVRVHRDPLRADRIALSLDASTDIGRVALPPERNPVGLPLDVTRPFTLGLDDNGQVFRYQFTARHVLIGGSPGSGKSNAMRVFLAYLAASRDVRLFGIDPKRVELVLWRDRFSGLLVGHDVDGTISLLEHLLDEVDHRTRALSKSGLASLPVGPDFPLVVLVVDEWAELAAMGDAKQRSLVASLLRRYVSLGRAVQCTSILCTQRPTSDVIDVGTRALLHDRFALKCGDRHQADSILGLGSYNATDLEAPQPGRALWSDGRPAVPFQFYEVTDAAVPELVCAGFRI